MTVHFQLLSALNMQKYFLFLSNFEHVIFLINRKYSKKLRQSKLLCFTHDILNIQKCNFKECPLIWVAPLTMFLPTMYKELHRKLVKLTNSLTKMLRSTIKVDAKKDICHSALTIKCYCNFFSLRTIHKSLPCESRPKHIKTNASKLKDKLKRIKCPFTSSNRSPTMNLDLER